ncbi:helix-turn-helix domain-containing protein [Yangia sp. PrR007]|nr:helix-turn-helix domain-containing protein [Salipiger sp. PrR003]NDW34425.1 helix-turn-helix domain-containing protein [Salipiger sp. PrR007]
MHVIATRRFRNDRSDRTSVRLAQAQEVFGIRRVTFYRWAAAGQIRIYKKGEISLLKVSEIETFLESRTEVLQDVASQCASAWGATSGGMP